MAGRGAPPGKARGNGGEVVLAQHLGGVIVEGAVVGADGVDLARHDRLPQGVHVVLGAQRGREDVLGALKAGEMVFLLRHGQILGAGLQIDFLSSCPGGPGGFQPPAGGEVGPA